VAAKDDDLFKSCAVICNRLRLDLDGDGEREHKTDQDNRAFEIHAASPESMDKKSWKRSFRSKLAGCERFFGRISTLLRTKTRRIGSLGSFASIPSLFHG
jgi:hypothetical protein